MRLVDVQIKVIQSNKIQINSNSGVIKKNFNGNGLKFYENKVFLQSKKNYNFFLKILESLSYGVKYGYFIEINFIGLGYRFLKLKDYLLLKLGFSHYIKYRIPTSLFIVGYKRKLIIYGIRLQEVKQVAKQLQMFKQPNIYKGRGIQIFGEVIALKVGKQK